jgi:hypothetical protein
MGRRDDDSVDDRRPGRYELRSRLFAWLRDFAPRPPVEALATALLRRCKPSRRRIFLALPIFIKI